MIRKLRAGMMPPSGAKRPDEADTGLAHHRARDPHRSRRERRPAPAAASFQRLNRAEYARAVRDLLALDIDVSGLLPADTISAGFDNVSDSQMFSPTLMEAYLRAASKVTSLAVGDSDAESGEALYLVPKTSSQMERVEGAPFGTRGGVSVIHTFPADGDYVFRMQLHGNADGFLFGGPATGEQAEVSIDGERVAVVDVAPRMADVTGGLALKTPVIHVTAGPHRVSAAFIRRFEGPVNDLIAPIDHTLADTQIGVSHGITTLPHLKDLAIVGPQKVTGISDTPSRRKIFACRPTGPAEEQTCAARIVRELATQAFRRPVTTRDFDRLMTFYKDGRADGDFEYGVASALEAILASPQFLFRLEPVPATAVAGQPYRLDDLALASRLSFFIWGSGPDAALMKAATAGTLSAPGALDRQVRRMLADPRSDALAMRFAAQWLRLARRRADSAGRDSLPLLRSLARPRDGHGDGAVLRQPGPRGPHGAGPADRRLHLRERPPGASLRHPEHRRQRVPARDRAGRAPRPAGQGQRAAADLGGRSHLAGDARQVGDGGDARIAAAAAAAQRARPRRDQGRPARRACSPCASAWSSTAPTRRAARATA